MPTASTTTPSSPTVRNTNGALGRDTRGLAYALATRHGELKVKQLMEELDPGFNILKGCNLDHPISRDIAQFILHHAIPNEASSSTVVSENAPARPETSEPDQRQQADGFGPRNRRRLGDSRRTPIPSGLTGPGMPGRCHPLVGKSPVLPAAAGIQALILG